MTCSLIPILGSVLSPSPRGRGNVLLATPQLNFIFQIDAVFPLHSFANFFREGERVRGFGIFTFGHNEIACFSELLLRPGEFPSTRLSIIFPVPTDWTRILTKQPADRVPCGCVSFAGP